MLKLNNLTGFGGAGVAATAAPDTDFFAWANNTDGQAGDGGTTNPILVPTNTDTTDGIDFKSNSFTWASHMGYLIGNDYSTAGRNQYGQLGLGDTIARNVFTAVSTLGSDVTDFACGGFHSLTVRNGDINGTGRNNFDQLTSATSDPSLTFSSIVQGNFSRVYASIYSSAALNTGGEIFVWGRQLGLLTGGGDTNPEPVNVLDFEGVFESLSPLFSDCALGDNHALLLDSDGNVYAMGSTNTFGQMGTGSTSSNPVATVLAYDGSSIPATKISCARTTSYIIAGGILFAAGRGNNGEMGAVTSTNPNPLFVDIGGGITDWIDVQGGLDYVIAQRQDGTLYHSGPNDDAQQGNGSTGTDNFGFVQIDGGTTAKVYTAFVAANSTIYGLS